jgi:NADH-quinone oxidoreductase subunit F
VAEITPVLTRHIVPGRPPLELVAYRDAGGYEGLRQAVQSMSPEQVRATVKESNLRGRGGAGFPCGVKWGFVPQGDDAPRPKYVIANGDEMEPGTFKDRLLIHGNPHQLIEGMIIAGWALQADIGYVFLRPEYERGAQLLEGAIREATAAGLLGDDILGSGWSFEIHPHTSAGRYICGEETALMNALEGRRPNPRSRPPYPAIAGLWGKPTIVQNIETLCCVPHIVAHGAEWFRKLGLTEDAGTKLYCVSGHVNRPGNYELPIGVTLRELLFEHCGGMRDGKAFKAAIPGGASTMFMTADELDTPLDFTNLEKAGNRLGTAAVIVADEDTSIVGMTLNLMHFFAQESCGWCTPCREGLPWIEDLLRDLVEGRGQPGDPQLMGREMRMIGPNSFCALALGAEGPLLSALQKFPDEFEAYVGGGTTRAHTGSAMAGGRPTGLQGGSSIGASTQADDAEIETEAGS